MEFSDFQKKRATKLMKLYFGRKVAEKQTNKYDGIVVGIVGQCNSEMPEGQFYMLLEDICGKQIPLTFEDLEESGAFKFV